MSLTLLNFTKILDKNFFHERKPKIAVGVSGGPDSLALTILLNHWILKKKGTIVALIVDHRIRNESLSESIQTKFFLNELKIRTKVLFVPRNKVKEGKMNQARFNRFEQLINYCKKNEIFHLFLGHHFNDNLETFILRKIAGSNYEGLNSIQLIKILGNIQVIRPLLFFTKKEILSFNEKFNLPFIFDPSNLNIKYSRIAIREYLNLNKNKKKEIIKEFKLIKNNYSLYIQMIYEIMNLLIIKAKYKTLVLNAKNFLLLNNELKEIIITKSMQYVNNSNFYIRSKKIKDLIRKISKFRSISLNSYKTSIQKLDNEIIVQGFRSKIYKDY